MSNSPMPVPSNPNAIGDLTKAVSGAAAGVASFLNRKKNVSSRTEHFEAGHGGAGSVTMEDLHGVLDKLHSQTLEVNEQAQKHKIASMKAAAEIAGPSKSGSRKTVQSTPEGGMTISHTTAAAPRTKKPAAKPVAAKTATAKPAAPVAKMPRGGKK